jgi:hypothetical protein
MSATTTQLLSSGEFYKLRYNTIPVKSESANVPFYTNNSKKSQILSCDTLVANERYNAVAYVSMTTARQKAIAHITTYGPLDK